MEEKLARAAIGCKKMTDWLVAAPSIEWDDDPDLPEIEAVEDIERREQARIVEEKEGIRNLCEVMVMDIVSKLEARSSACNIMEEVLSTAWDKIKLESAWSMLKGDRIMQEIILIRLRVMEEDKAKTKLLELKDMKDKDKSKLDEFEVEEHRFLDSFAKFEQDASLVDMIETGPDWEQVEMENLDNILEDPATEDKTLQRNLINKLGLSCAKLSSCCG